MIYFLFCVIVPSISIEDITWTPRCHSVQPKVENFDLQEVKITYECSNEQLNASYNYSDRPHNLKIKQQGTLTATATDNCENMATCEKPILPYPGNIILIVIMIMKMIMIRIRIRMIVIIIMIIIMIIIILCIAPFGSGYKALLPIIMVRKMATVVSFHLRVQLANCIPYQHLDCNIFQGRYIPDFAQVNQAIETKYLAQGHKHIGTSRAQTLGLVILSPALFH